MDKWIYQDLPIRVKIEKSRLWIVKGDFCYDMYEDNGNKSDQWMDFIMPVAANIPFQAWIYTNFVNRFIFTHTQ